ncbi:alkyl hydroperoxide reductase [Leptospira hartskeerlii]|uniref:Alkyl hydroperoxide reductase n=1 Tax=Leptospira hartskeerlii TaxID=2023177 RepID=A0A2M9XA84_9LEPT|nr:NAD(P)/FAD-dependent oxidoreductase [Leptospira hartskeerlii]PJZ24606.1 alkyl hydroperoxide reductase [Leptospira hartskeerlii]PJZ32781.1 alkyl hydroperoxide reductase [Leptospira hartskeerlii]
MKFDYEVLITGGGPAGLSAALALGRMSRTALICDDSRPRNAASSHLNNFPTRDGIHPAEWRKLARKDLEKYNTISLFEGSVLSVEKSGPGFVAKLSSDKTFHFKKIILAYGVEDKFLPVPGYKELWGKSIFHCPYCHGFEVRNAKLGLIGNGDTLFFMLPLIYDLASDLVIFTNGKAEFKEEQRALLHKKKIPFTENTITGFIYEGEKLKSVSFENGENVERDGLYALPTFPFKLKSTIGEELGCEKDHFGFYKVGERGKTSVDGVYACGDNASGAHSVLLAAASGGMAGAGVVHELLSEKLLE